LHAKIVANRPILIELWLGEVRCWDGEIRSQNLPGPISKRIGHFFTNNAYKCR